MFKILSYRLLTPFKGDNFMKYPLFWICFFLPFTFPNTSYSQAVAGAPNLNIVGSIASFNLAPPGLGVTGEISN